MGGDEQLMPEIIITEREGPWAGRPVLRVCPGRILNFKGDPKLSLTATLIFHFGLEFDNSARIVEWSSKIEYAQ